MVHYFDYVIEIFTIVSLSLFIGNFFLKLTNFPYLKKYTQTFLALLTGILVLTIAQAIIATRFNTILLIAPIILAIGYYLDKKHSHQKYAENHTNYCDSKPSEKYFTFAEIFILAILFYSIKFFALFQNGDPYLLGSAGLGDFTFYSRCADYMLRTGIEECNNDYLFTVSNRPYHYADLWFVALIANINKNITHFSLAFTFRAIYLATVYTGIMAILENKCSLKFKIKIAVVLTIFFAPLYIDAYANIRFLSDKWIFAQTFFESPKLFFVQVLIIAAILLNAIGYRKLGVATLLSIAVLYTVVIVPVYAGFMVYMIYTYYSNKKVAYGELIISVICALYIIIYYFMINPPGTEVDGKRINLVDLVNFGHTINIIGGTVLAHIVLYSPVVLIFSVYIYYTKPRHHLLSELAQNPIYIFVLAMPVFSLLLWSITSGDVNSVQLFYNIATPVFYTCSIIILVSSFILLNKYFRVLIFTYLLLTAFHELPKFPDTPTKYSSDFIREVKSKIITFNGIYVTYKPISYYDGPLAFYEKSNNFGDYFSYLINNAQPVSLDVIDVPIVGDINYERMATQQVKTSTFYRYIEDKKKKGISKSNSEYQLDFIKENNVRILVTLKSVELPNYLDALIIDKIEDSISGELVCVLMNQSNQGR